MNTVKKGVITQNGMTYVVNDKIIERMNDIIKKDNKEVSMKWILLEIKPPYNATDIWYITDTKTNKKEEVLCSELLETYPVLKKGEITQKEYFVKLKEATPLLEKFDMTNARIGESLPLIEESLYHEMSEEDKKTYDALPNEVTIYRGAYMKEHPGQVGQAWTLDRNVAGFFAWSYYDVGLPSRDSSHRVVFEAKISKEFIFAYYSERSEDTCIVERCKLKHMKVYKKYSKKNAKHTLDKFNAI